MKLNTAATAVAILTALNLLAAERITLDADWRFNKGDADGTGTNLSYANIKAWVLPTGNALRTTNSFARPDGEPAADVAFAQPGFDDSAWRKLNLPHDFGVEGAFDWKLPGETGKLPWSGVAWYRKKFSVSAADDGKQIALDVDGAMAYASVWLNGKLVGGWPYGYSSWRVDLTPFVKFGGENVLAIRLDNPKESSRWYPGGGIYRNVWLVKSAPVHVAHWGVAVTTPQVSAKSAMIHVKVSLDNISAADATVKVETAIYPLNPDGTKSKNAVSWLEGAGTKISAGATAFVASEADVAQTVPISRPKLWSVAHPNRYVAVTTVSQGEKNVDEVETPFGIRTIEFTVTNGFLLNGERVQIQGVCDHHDLGALGSAINTRALERQLEILREFGCNAIRTSHNPPTPELLNLCDQLGFLVMDEAFDCWASGKNKNDYHVLYRDWHEADLRALVRRDRNHPSVILWSSGNEVSDQDKAAGPALAEKHRGIIHSEDPTRPCTTAVSSTKAGFSGFQNHFDVFGWNYRPFFYADFRKTNALVPFVASETSSTVSSRGEYFFPVPTEFKSKNTRTEKSASTNASLSDFQVSSYDSFVPSWATTPDMEWRGQEENPFVAGEFVWTGFDYLGEPTPFNADVSNLLNYSTPEDKVKAKEELDRLGKIRVPSRSSYFGIVDLAGFKKDRFYLYQSHWRPDFPMAHILPHWNWPERVGQVTPVFVYTSGDSAELFLNGKSLGKKSKGKFEYRLRWNDVVYQPGELKVVAYKNGKRWAGESVHTTGAAAKLALSADRAKIAADGKDLSFITATIADQRGDLVPRSKNQIHFSITGPGEIVATDNGDATSFESFQSPDRKAYNGLALVIIRATAPGKITLTAKSDGLATATTTIRAN